MSTEYKLLVLDRYEGSRAVLVADGGTTFNEDRALLPEGAREGAVLRVPMEGPGEMRWESARVDEEATEERLRQARDMLKGLKRRDPGGDVVL